MTKKRFEMKKGIRQFIDCQNDKTYCEYNLEDVVDLLNELHEENQSLKDKIAFLEEFITSGVEYTYSQNIYDENEQLKKQIGNLEHTRDFCADVCADCKRLEKENESLKQKINELQTDKALGQREYQRYLND